MSVAPKLSGDPAAPSAVPTRSGAGAPRAASSGFGALLLRLHFYAGVLVAPFLFVAALTGLAYTVTPQLDQIVYGDELRPGGSGPAARPMADQITAARAAHPDGTLTTVVPGDADATTRITFTVDGLADDRAHSTSTRTPPRCRGS
jgi:uncharacterized iron-regulated membrane protein